MTKVNLHTQTLAGLLEKVDLKQYWIAEEIGVSARSLSRWKNGQVRTAPADAVSRLARLLGVSPITIAKFSKPAQNNTNLSIYCESLLEDLSSKKQRSKHFSSMNYPMLELSSARKLADLRENNNHSKACHGEEYFKTYFDLIYACEQQFKIPRAKEFIKLALQEIDTILRQQTHEPYRNITSLLANQQKLRARLVRMEYLFGSKTSAKKSLQRLYGHAIHLPKANLLPLIYLQGFMEMQDLNFAKAAETYNKGIASLRNIKATELERFDEELESLFYCAYAICLRGLGENDKSAGYLEHALTMNETIGFGHLEFNFEMYCSFFAVLNGNIRSAERLYNHSAEAMQRHLPNCWISPITNHLIRHSSTKEDRNFDQFSFSSASPLAAIPHASQMLRNAKKIAR